MSDNLNIYNKVRKVPDKAKKEIKAGRIKGFTDINPMWRIKTLTETFGLVGFGWKYTIKRTWIEESSNDIKTANVEIELFVKQEDKWSEAIPGIGGSMFSTLESKGLYTSDECYKMALTDAISVACKSIGIGADVYWGADATKYDNPDTPLSNDDIQKIQKQTIFNYATQNQEWLMNLLTFFNVGTLEDLTPAQTETAYKSILKKQQSK